MTTRSTKPLKRTLLSFGVAIAIVVAPHSYANPQFEPQQNGILGTDRPCLQPQPQSCGCFRTPQQGLKHSRNPSLDNNSLCFHRMDRSQSLACP